MSLSSKSCPKSWVLSRTPIKSVNHLSAEQTRLSLALLPLYPSLFPSEPQQPSFLRRDTVCGATAVFVCAYHGRCWGTWGELSPCPRESPLWCPPGRPSAVSRPPLLLSWGSHSDWRGMETLHIQRSIYKQKCNVEGGFCNSVCKHSPQSSWTSLTWRRRRLARRSLPPCSLLEDKIKLLKQKYETRMIWGTTYF